MASEITTALTKDGSVRVLFINSTEIVKNAQRIHETAVTATAVIGRALSITSLMGYMLKGDKDSITFQLKGDGPAGSVVCVSDSQGNVRGYMDNPKVDIPERADGKINVGAAVGKGSLVIIRDLGMKEPYCGLSELKSGEIAEDVTEYFVKSEQIPTVCALGVMVGTDTSCLASGGILLQLMPFYDEKVIATIEENVKKFGSISAKIAGGQNATTIITQLLGDLPFDIMDTKEVMYKCTCSREKYKNSIKSLGLDQLNEMAFDDKPIEACCMFCNSRYDFSKEEIKNMINEK